MAFPPGVSLCSSYICKQPASLRIMLQCPATRDVGAVVEAARSAWIIKAEASTQSEPMQAASAIALPAVPWSELHLNEARLIDGQDPSSPLRQVPLPQASAPWPPAHGPSLQQWRELKVQVEADGCQWIYGAWVDDEGFEHFDAQSMVWGRIRDFVVAVVAACFHCSSCLEPCMS